jgi:hypothetical protein
LGGRRLPAEAKCAEVVRDRMCAQGFNESEPGEEEPSVPEGVSDHEDDGVVGRLAQESDDRIGRKDRREKDRNLPCEIGPTVNPRG